MTYPARYSPPEAGPLSHGEDGRESEADRRPRNRDDGGAAHPAWAEHDEVEREQGDGGRR